VKLELPIHDLAARHYGLTRPIADSYTEAARVCFDRHHHSPIDIEIKRSEQAIQAYAKWQSPDERMRRAWAHEIDTTEAGAYACTLAAVELSCGLVAVHRAETKTGADYYVAPAGPPPDDLENCVRLEISGLDRASSTAVVQRLKEKLKQAAAGSSNLPAMAGVVGFRARLILVAPVGEK